MMDDIEPLKIVMIGDSAVGKTCIVLRYAEERFNNDHLSTMGVDYFSKEITIDDALVKVQIWDTAGQERFRSIAKNYIKGAQGIMLVYDVTCKKAFDGITVWLEQLKEIALPNIKIMILGNKCDDISNRVVSTEEGSAFAQSYHVDFFETSAKDNINIDQAYDKLIKMVYAEAVLSAKREEETRQKIHLEKQQLELQKKKKCC